MMILAHLIKFRWLYGGLAGLLFISGVYFTGYVKGRHKAEIECAQEKAAESQRGINIHGKVKTTVAKLPDADLDKRLSKWVLD